MPNQDKYIFESPDQGRTIYRRKPGTSEKELASYRLDMDINHAIMIAGALPAEVQQEVTMNQIYHNFQKSTDVWQIKPFLGQDADKKLGLDKLNECQTLISTQGGILV
jgi:hypothetical protein